MDERVESEDSERRLIEAVLGAYRRGWFPMADMDAAPGEPDLAWYDPDPRGVIPLELDSESEQGAGGGFHIPRRLAERLRAGPFVVTTDRAFGEVIRRCADPNRAGTWIDERLCAVFELLARAGHAHSVEVWKVAGLGGGQGEAFDVRAPGPISSGEAPEGAALVGGLYGLAVGGLFAGESMFSLPELGGTDASKIALVRTVFHLRARGFALFDSQFWNEHLDQFGCCEIKRAEYRRRLAGAVEINARW